MLSSDEMWVLAAWALYTDEKPLWDLIVNEMIAEAETFLAAIAIAQEDAS